MQIGSVATPFGRRAMTCAQLQQQMATKNLEKDAQVDKWKIYRSLCAARAKFGLTDRALALLNALLSFYPRAELTAGDDLVVFPSNAQLSLRAHGMAEQTIRRHIAALVSAGLVIRRDSANGKRFARRNIKGAINEAFGFSLAPLVARAEEIERKAAQVQAEQMRFRQLKEHLTICRRDLRTLFAIAIDECEPALWQFMKAQFEAVLARHPRNPDFATVSATFEILDGLRAELMKRLEIHEKAQKPGGFTGQNERHIQNSESETILEHDKAPPAANPQKPDTAEFPSPGVQDTTSAVAQPSGPARTKRNAPSNARTYPLPVIKAACPDIVDYGPDGNILSWRDLVSASLVVARMLNISRDAYEEACKVLGLENTATVIACLLQKADQISCSGGYLRDLTCKAKAGKFDVGRMLNARLRADVKVGKGDVPLILQRCPQAVRALARQPTGGSLGLFQGGHGGCPAF